MIGMALPAAAAGTYPTRASPRTTEPATKIGSPRIDGSPASAGEGGGATGRATAAGVGTAVCGSATVDKEAS